MGCKQSKEYAAVQSPKGTTAGATIGSASSGPGSPSPPGTPSKTREQAIGNGSNDHRKSSFRNKKSTTTNSLFAMLKEAQSSNTLQNGFWGKVHDQVRKDPNAVGFVDQETQRTAFHLTCSMLDPPDDNSMGVVVALEAMLQSYPDALAWKDTKGYAPMHYAVRRTRPPNKEPPARWRVRAEVIRMLVAADFDSAQEYLSRNDVVFDKETGGVTPLYHGIQALPDDFASHEANEVAPTVDFIKAIHESTKKSMVGIGNARDGDKPLALLYRRFTRQFDLSEKFFAGDNSREEVVQHRQNYKCAAGHTWAIMEILLQPEDEDGMNDYNGVEEDAVLHAQGTPIVHRSVQVETPPDLLRYIVETNAEDLTRPDAMGNLPLHYAAMSRPPKHDKDGAHFPAFYSKYVMDELLYKFPEAASLKNRDGKFALTLAVHTNKQWIGGGVKSLYDAYPDALHQIDLDGNPALQKALSFQEDEEEQEDDKEESNNGTIIRDEHHDGIMLIQSAGVQIDEVISCMWAHEEDAGVQMLGCVAVGRLAGEASQPEVLRISLSSVAAVVNAMKAHPNEPIVQDKACTALRKLTPADGYREVSFVASGAIAAIVGAMQAHLGDASVQQEALAALADLVSHSGSDRATVVASVSGLTAIVNAMAAHPSSEPVQQESCRALKAMTDYGQEANLPELPRSQTEPLLQNAIAQFPASCKAPASEVLSRLS